MVAPVQLILPPLFPLTLREEEEEENYVTAKMKESCALDRIRNRLFFCRPITLTCDPAQLVCACND